MMTLDTLEKELGVVFPKLYHEAYNNGDLEWIQISLKEFQVNSRKYIDSVNSFMIFPSLCELNSFEVILDKMDDLNELLKEWQDEKVTLLDGIKMIPFGQSAGGDFYCFLYDGESEEPKVIQIWHDMYDDPAFEANDFETFLFIQILDALVDDCLDLQGEVYLHHKKYLSEEHRKQLEGMNKEQIAELYYNIPIDDYPIMK